MSHEIRFSVLWLDEGPIMNDTTCRLDDDDEPKT